MTPPSRKGGRSRIPGPDVGTADGEGDVRQRQGDKVFGVIEYVTGRFWYQGLEGRLNAEASIAFLTRVLEQTTPPIMLIQRGATYHTSAAMQRFALHTARLTVFQLPSDSPDDTPIEKL